MSWASDAMARAKHINLSVRKRLVATHAVHYAGTRPKTIYTSGAFPWPEVKKLGRPYKCPYCGSNESVWKGYRTTKAGRVRLRRCKNCSRRFTTRKLVPPSESDGDAI